MAHLHSVPARPHPRPCETFSGRAHPRLRPYVLGYAGFRSGDGAALAHRVLPINSTTMIVDYAAGGRVVTGPRSAPAVFERTRWGHGVCVGLTPLGASALLGVPMRELAGGSVPLADLLGHDGEILAERLDAAPDWPARFAVLDELFSARLDRDGGWAADGLALRAWARLQEPGAPRVGALAAELGVSRRGLEVRFRRQVGLSPATVARVARFQRAVWLLAAGRDLPATAQDSGYADQPHFNREVRAMAGLTPGQLCAFLQYRELAPR
ncbi:helix-turn-helix domain-containing protein [Phytohabitans sp. ZYX-F-186]|uniref:Helix-turn-helix domain-containing protein n=1 Tax=Phytohabitans maris TaxID=3071409 RepID=A0ABU0ZT24_9ACTN|nr:helix-turn-helix domain-containing protein [Phytohabitans sp. ZYX-F-186]MDQ7909459.1 helix-turn-helix domain-containing protein [Phytohabitans sp. ZYX-F-186]